MLTYRALVEYYYNDLNHDLYLNGQNIALSNLLWYCLPVFCDKSHVKAMYSAFESMMRTKEDESINHFYNEISRLKETSSYIQFNEELDLILATHKIVHPALEGLDKFSIDPSIPALFLHCVQWGEEYPNGFDVKHDNSKTLEQQQHMVTQFMDWSKTKIIAGYDRRKFTLPLKSKKMEFVCSKQVKQVQVMDILASGLAYWASQIISGKTNDSFFKKLSEIGFDDLIGNNKIWPEPYFTPQDLNTIYDGGINPADASTCYLMS